MRDLEEYEIIEYDLELMTRGDYDGVLQLRSNQLKKYPHDYHVNYQWAEILVLKKRYEEALNILSQLHSREKEDEDVIDLVIDCIKGLSKSIADFDWKIEPNILYLNDDLINMLKYLLKGKRGEKRAVSSMYLDLLSKGNLFFDGDEFYDFLKSSKRVHLSNNQDWFEVRIEKIN